MKDTVDKEDSLVTAKPKPVSVKKNTSVFNSSNRYFTFDTTGFTLQVDTSWTWQVDTSTWTWVDGNTLSSLTDLKNYSQVYPFGQDTVTVSNQVEYNELLNQKVKLKTRRVDSTMYVKQTDTLYKEKSRVILYFGAGLYGNKESAGGIFKVALKGKNDYIFSAGRMQGFGDNSYWFGGVDIPIKLRKK